MYTMNSEERATRETIKTLHKRVRADMREAARHGGEGHRYMLLAWAFMRGLPFRRIERSHHVQEVNGKLYEHNMPSYTLLTKALSAYLPQFEADMESKWLARRGCRAEIWINDPDGAIPAPAPRAKRPYVQPIAAE